MTKFSELYNLVETLENLEGPSRPLDVALHSHFGFVEVFETRRYGDNYHYDIRRVDSNRILHAWDQQNLGPYSGTEPLDIGGCVGWDVFTVPPYTNSVDAASMLVERVLPGWTWNVEKRPNTAIAYIHNNQSHFVGAFAKANPDKRWFEIRHKNSPAIALCMALVSSGAIYDPART